MADYKKMYYLLFRKITEIIEELQEVQQQAEALYITEKEPAMKLYPTENKKQHANTFTSME